MLLLFYIFYAIHPETKPSSTFKVGEKKSWFVEFIYRHPVLTENQPSLRV